MPAAASPPLGGSLFFPSEREAIYLDGLDNGKYLFCNFVLLDCCYFQQGNFILDFFCCLRKRDRIFRIVVLHFDATAAKEEAVEGNE